jgi:hypothetical protein
LTKSNIFARIVSELSDPENGIIATFNEEDQCIEVTAPRVDYDMIVVFESEELRIVELAKGLTIITS